MPTFRGITYTEFNPDGEGLMGSFATGGSRVHRGFDVPWADHVNFLQQVIGFQSVLPVINSSGQTRFYITRTTPMPDPLYPQLWCRSIPTLKGVKDAGLTAPQNITAAYNRARMTVEFLSNLYKTLTDEQVSSSPLAGILGQFQGVVSTEADGLVNTVQSNEPPRVPLRYVTRMVRPANRVITLRQGTMCFVNQLPEDAKEILFGNKERLFEGLPVSEGRATLTYTWHNVPENGIPVSAITACLGQINSIPFGGTGVGGANPRFDSQPYPAQTLLFDSVTITPDLDIKGNLMYQVQYQFVFAPNFDKGGSKVARGWNWVLRYKLSNINNPTNPNGSILNYYLVSSDGTLQGTKPKELRNFGALFVPDQNPVVY